MTVVGLRKIFRNAASLAVGAGAAQIIALASVPLLILEYTPSQFGSLALFTLVVNLVAVPATAGLAPAILKPSSDEEARALASAAQLTGLILGVVVCAILILAAELTGAEELSSGIALISGGFSVWLLSVHASLMNTLLRHGHFRALTLGRITGALMTAVAALACPSFFRDFQQGMIVAVPIGVACSVLVLFCARGRSGARISPGARMSAVLRHREYLQYSAPQSGVDILRDVVFAAVMTRGFDPTILGYYYLAQRLVGAPLSLLGASMSQSLTREISLLVATQRSFWRLYDHTVHLLFVCGLITVATVGLAGPWLLVHLLGQGWALSGIILGLLAPFYLVQFVTSPLFSLPPILGQQRPAMLWGFAYAVSQLVPLAVCIHMGVGIGPAIFAVSMSVTICLIAALLWLNAACRWYHAILKAP